MNNNTHLSFLLLLPPRIISIMLKGFSRLPRLPVSAVQRICKMEMSVATQPSLPKFIPLEDPGTTSTTISNGADSEGLKVEIEMRPPSVAEQSFLVVKIHNGFRFRVVSYNILAQVYVKSSLFPHSPSPCLKWKARSQAILTVLKSFEADFLCIQELDEYDSFYKGNMDSYGYSSLYIQRSGQKRDGCGIFYKRNSAELMLKEEIEYNDLVKSIEDGTDLCNHQSDVVVDTENQEAVEGLPQRNFSDDRGDPNDPRVRLKRDCVGLMAAFKLNDPSHHLVIVANTHIYWDPEWADVKLAQVKYLQYRLAQFKAMISNKFNCTPSVIVAGDFNSTPGDEVYQYLVSGNSSAMSVAENGEERAIPLCSLYAFIGGEPPFTNCTPGFTGTLDYIFFSDSGYLKTVSFLELPGPDSPEVVGGLPNYHHPSDHLPIGTDFEVIIR